MIARRLIRCGGLSGVLLAAGALAGPRLVAQAPGVRIVEVAPGAAVPGLREGDVLTGWSFEGQQGSFVSPFDYQLVEEAYSLRGSVLATGFRVGAVLKLTLSGPAWGGWPGPAADDAMLTQMQQARGLFRQGGFEEATKRWEELAARTSGVWAAWFYAQAGESAAAQKAWAAVDRDFGAALGATVPGSAGRLQVNAAWAESYRRRMLWSEAIARQETSLADADKLGLKLTRARLLIRLTQTYKDERQTARAIALVQEAVAIRKELLPGSRSMAEALLFEGSCYLDVRKFDEAEASIHAALDTVPAGQAPDMLQAKALHNLGVAAQARGRMAEAHANFENSLKISEKVEPEGEQFASTNSSLGTVLRAQGDFEGAQQHLEASVRLRRKAAPGSLALAAALNNLGNLHRARGNFVPAQAAYEEALALNLHLAPQSPDVAGAWMNLGDLAYSRGDLTLAADDYERSRALWAKIDPHGAYWAETLIDLGQVRQDQGNLRQAEQLFNEALAVPEWQKLSPLDAAGMRQALAELYAKQGRTVEAVKANQEALAIVLRVVPGSLKEADLAMHLGALARTQADAPGAERYYREALVIQERLVPDTAEIAESLHGLGLLARQAGDTAQAVAMLSRAVDALEAQSARLGGSELVNAGFRASYSEYYRDLADMLLSLGRQDDAFSLTERYRARSLLDQLAQRNLTISGVPKELTARLHANAVEYEQVQAQLARLPAAQTRPQVDALRVRLTDLSAARAATIEEIRRGAPGFAGLRFPAALNAAQAQSALDPGTVLISFLVEQATTYAFVLDASETGGAMSVYKVAVGEAALRRQVEAFRASIQSSDQSDQSRLRKQAGALYRLLLAPAELKVSHAQRLTILPDGPLYSLPFSALMRKGAFLAEWKPVTTTLSATLFTQLRQQRRAPESYRLSLAAFGNALYAQGDGTGTNVARRSGVQSGAALMPLKFSRVEAEEIARLFPRRSELYEGAAATEEHAKGLGRDVRYIHFAVHGLLNEENPLDSALAFSTPQTPHAGRENGLLQAWELYQDAHWDADLVVLSACESALGRELAGEGLVGLTRAVHYAGARSVISSLWNVDDQKTQKLMTALYTNLRDGMPKDAALQAAQTMMLRSRGGAAPYYWAGFTLQGDWK